MFVSNFEFFILKLELHCINIKCEEIDKTSLSVFDARINASALAHARIKYVSLKLIYYLFTIKENDNIN